MKVLVLMGVCGCGKSTVAKMLADRLQWEYVDGDDLHPASNVAKMSVGQPLTDEERLPWLRIIASWIADRCSDVRDRPGIVTCSALKREYRDVLRSGCGGGGRERDVIFVHLVGTRQQIVDRLSTRVGHFMPTSLLDTQLETLEPFAEDERSTSLVVDIGKSADRLVADIIRRLELKQIEQ